MLDLYEAAQQVTYQYVISAGDCVYAQMLDSMGVPGQQETLL